MLRRRIIWILNCFVFALPMQAAAHKPHVSLRKQIEAILSQPDLSRGFWGIEISSVANGKALYSLNADKLFTPASNTKLFTTAAALTINDNVVFVNILPGAHPGDKAFVSLTPFADYYTIDNRLMTMPAGTARKLYINREPGSTQLTLWGSIAADDPGANEGLAIEDPAEFAASLLRHLLEIRGVAVYGKQRTRHTELASLSTFTSTVIASRGGDEHSLTYPAGPLVLAEYPSAPLSEDIRVINKVSQNLHAEILLRPMGREKGTGGTVQAGLEVLRGFLNNAGVPAEEYVFYDGSGLSRQNLVTPHAVVELLRYASAQPWGSEFRY